MSHLNTNYSVKKWISLGAYLLLIAVSFSCAKKPETIRAVKKNETINMNPAVSSQSESQGQAQGVIYKIVTVSRPTSTNTGFTVDADIQTPDNNFIPLTTTHDSTGALSQGSFQDSARGVVVRVQAQCLGDGCFKYLLLVTVTKNNTSVFQSAAVSFKDDLKFYSVSILQGVDSFFQSIDELNSYSDTHNFVARNDCTEKDCPTGN